jgi:hypothetical protein
MCEKLTGGGLYSFWAVIMVMVVGYGCLWWSYGEIMVGHGWLWLAMIVMTIVVMMTANL